MNAPISIFALQWEHLPFKKMKLRKGMSSVHLKVW